MTFAAWRDYRSPVDVAIAADRRRRARFWRDARRDGRRSNLDVLAVAVVVLVSLVLLGGCGDDETVYIPAGAPECEKRHSAGLYVWLDDNHVATATDTVCTHNGPACKRPRKGGPTPVNNGGSGGER